MMMHAPGGATLTLRYLDQVLRTRTHPRFRRPSCNDRALSPHATSAREAYMARAQRRRRASFSTRASSTRDEASVR